MNEQLPVPEITDINRPYWDSLASGVLHFQSCVACGHRWLPARSHCPSCLSGKTIWIVASGGGRVVSWAIFHTAYHEALKDRVPYDVTVVELDEGPRLLSNVINSDAGTGLSVGARVELIIETEGDVSVPRFKLV